MQESLASLGSRLGIPERQILWSPVPALKPAAFDPEVEEQALREVLVSGIPSLGTK